MAQSTGQLMEPTVLISPTKHSLLDGTDDYVSLGDVLDPGTSDVSVSMWFKWAGTQVGNNTCKYSTRYMNLVLLVTDCGMQFNPHGLGPSTFSVGEDNWNFLTVYLRSFTTTIL